MKLKAVRTWASRIVTIILTLILIFMVFVVISSKASGGDPNIFGYQLKTVLSGSMEPGIKTGSIILVKPGGDMTRFEKDDVITFKQEEDMLVTHRIVEVVKNGDKVMYRTKGDNNNAKDQAPVLAQNVVAEYTGVTVPYIGYVTDFSKSKNGSLLMLVLPGVLLLAYSAFTIWKTISHIEIKSKDEKIEKSSVIEESSN